jgi:hypothetical protein
MVMAGFGWSKPVIDHSEQALTTKISADQPIPAKMLVLVGFGWS